MPPWSAVLSDLLPKCVSQRAPLASYGELPDRWHKGGSSGRLGTLPAPPRPSTSAEQPQRRCLRWLRAEPSRCPAAEQLPREPSRSPAAEPLPREPSRSPPGSPPRGRAAPAVFDEDGGAPGGQRVAPPGLPQRAPRHHGPASTGLPPVSTETKGGRAPKDQIKRAGRSCPPPRGAGLGPIRPRCLILAHPDGSSSPGYLLGSCAFWRPAGRWGPRPSSTSLRRARFP